MYNVETSVTVSNLYGISFMATQNNERGIVLRSSLWKYVNTWSFNLNLLYYYKLAAKLMTAKTNKILGKQRRKIICQ